MYLKSNNQYFESQNIIQGRRILVLEAMLMISFIFNSLINYDLISNFSGYFIVPYSVAVISAVYGNREATLKKTIKQTIPVDFHCFVENENISNNGAWIKDPTKYQFLDETKSPLDDGKMVNSLSKNKHPYNQYKYYKTQFHRIPKLKQYQYIIWIDSSFRMKSNTVCERLVNLISNSSFQIMFYKHPKTKTIAKEVKTMKKDARWKNTTLWGIEQPFQNLTKQIEDYYGSGFSDKYYNRIWVSGLFIIDMTYIESTQFLDEWYFQILNYSTQCQVSLPYAAWKVKYRVGDLSPGGIYKNPYFRYLRHYK